jgi:hypothetical protein
MFHLKLLFGSHAHMLAGAVSHDATFVELSASSVDIEKIFLQGNFWQELKCQRSLAGIEARHAMLYTLQLRQITLEGAKSCRCLVGP